MTKVAKQLTKDQLTEARVKALRNARELLEDAKILFRTKRWPRAFFLSRIAEEEMGKYWFLVAATVEATANKIDWKKFWKDYRNHEFKARRAVHLEMFGLPPFPRATELAKVDKLVSQIEKDRKSSLYSDISNNRFVSPDEVIGENLASQMLNIAEDRLELYELVEAKTLKSSGILDNLTKDKAEKLLKDSQSCG